MSSWAMWVDNSNVAHLTMLRMFPRFTPAHSREYTAFLTSTSTLPTKQSSSPLNWKLRISNFNTSPHSPPFSVLRLGALAALMLFIQKWIPSLFALAPHEAFEKTFSRPHAWILIPTICSAAESDWFVKCQKMSWGTPRQTDKVAFVLQSSCIIGETGQSPTCYFWSLKW